LLFVAARQFTVDEKASGDVLMVVGSMSVPQWIATAAIPGGFLLVAIHMLFKAADSAFDLR
jgi:hypothetical protein